MRHRRFGCAQANAHWRTLAPRVLAACKQRLKQRPQPRHSHHHTIERAQFMRALPGLGRSGEGAGTQNEACNLRCAGGPAVIPSRRYDHRAPPSMAAMIERINRILQGPVIGNAQIDRQRIGFAFGQNCNYGPVVAENRLPAGQHVAHGAIAAVDYQQIDPALRKFSQRFGQLCAGAGLGNVHLRTQAAIEIRTQIAVAARVVDHANAWCLPCIADRKRAHLCGGGRFGSRGLRKFVNRRCHNCPIGGERPTFHCHLWPELKHCRSAASLLHRSLR